MIKDQKEKIPLQCPSTERESIRIGKEQRKIKPKSCRRN